MNREQLRLKTRSVFFLNYSLFSRECRMKNSECRINKKCAPVRYALSVLVNELAFLPSGGFRARAPLIFRSRPSGDETVLTYGEAVEYEVIGSFSNTGYGGRM